MLMVKKYFKLVLLPNARTGMVLTFAFALIICLGTLTPLPQAVDVPGTDKWHHLLAFAALTYPLTIAGRRYWLAIIVFGLSFGASIEIIQPYVNRFRNIGDFTADAIGVLLGFSLGVIGYFLNFKFETKKLKR